MAAKLARDFSVPNATIEKLDETRFIAISISTPRSYETSLGALNNAVVVVTLTSASRSHSEKIANRKEHGGVTDAGHRDYFVSNFARRENRLIAIMNID